MFGHVDDDASGLLPAMMIVITLICTFNLVAEHNTPKQAKYNSRFKQKHKTHQTTEKTRQKLSEHPQMQYYSCMY